VSILEETREKLATLCEQERIIGSSDRIKVNPLSPDDAIGAKADGEFILKKGKERVIEAVFRGMRGQAFTDAPSEWVGTIRELLALDLSVIRNRAVFVAALLDLDRLCPFGR